MEYGAISGKKGKTKGKNILESCSYTEMRDCYFFFQLEWPRCERRFRAEGGATTGERRKNDLESGNDSMWSVDEHGTILGKK